MPICIFCGAEIHDGDPFCKNCGAPVLKEGETIEPITIEVPEGAEITIGDGPEMTHDEARWVREKQK